MLALLALAMPYPLAWSAVGWTIVASSAVLLLLPWRWHRAFAERAVPPTLRFIVPLGITSAVLGSVLVVAAMSAPSWTR